MKYYKVLITVALSWILCLPPMVSRAQDATAGEALPYRTVPLEVLSSPQDFAGRDVELLCWVSMKELNEGRCPAYSETGQRQGDIKVNIGAVSERERAFVSAHCVNQGEPIRCLVLIAGKVSVSDDGIPSILAPKLE